METPRRRSQNRAQIAEQSQNTEQVREERGASDINGPENCVKAVRVLMNELVNAKKTLINADNCVVNRAVMQAQLEYLDQNLPDTVRKAAEIVQAEATIRAETEAKKNEILSAAQSQAEQLASETRTQAQNLMDQANQEAHALMDRANQEANALMDKANQEATACVEAARAEAARMLEDAEKKARQLIEEENIVRRARVESDEIREKAQQETAQLQKNALDFVDHQLMEADRSISEMLNAIRLERNEVRNRRQ
ncbi:MAG: hypothetical protein IJ231_06880 [Clostridia bacterium]|nr:hypothetical protein [Clostridia bacterium]